MSRDLTDLVDVDVELARFLRRVRVNALQTLEGIDERLDHGTFLFLITISEHADGIRGTDLADQLGVHKSTASRAVSALEAMGLVRRVPDPVDRRAHRLVIEDKASVGIEEYRRTLRGRLTEVLSSWTQDEIEVFSRSLKRLNEGAEKLV